MCQILRVLHGKHVLNLIQIIYIFNFYFVKFLPQVQSVLVRFYLITKLMFCTHYSHPNSVLYLQNRHLEEKKQWKSTCCVTASLSHHFCNKKKHTEGAFVHFTTETHKWKFDIRSPISSRLYIRWCVVNSCIKLIVMGSCNFIWFMNCSKFIFCNFYHK